MAPIVLTLTLTRVAHLPTAVFGVLHLPDGSTTWTVEAPWCGNRANESCVPEGEYALVPGVYNRGGYPTWEIRDLPGANLLAGRTLLKFHRANLGSELRGCIAPGAYLGTLRGLWAVLESKRAHDRIMAALAGQTEARLVIQTYTVASGDVPRGP